MPPGGDRPLALLLVPAPLSPDPRLHGARLRPQAAARSPGLFLQREQALVAQVPAIALHVYPCHAGLDLAATGRRPVRQQQVADVAPVVVLLVAAGLY